MSVLYTFYDQLADMLAQLEPEKVMAIKATKEMEVRYDFLFKKQKNKTITTEEKSELEHFIALERFIRLAKIKADNPQSSHQESPS